MQGSIARAREPGPCRIKEVKMNLFRRLSLPAAALLVAALCLFQTGCESLRNHPLAGDHPPSRPWENTRLTTPPSADVNLTMNEAPQDLARGHGA
jgi:hypothetical protein